MNIFQENFNGFINNRIDDTINSLRNNNKNYKNNLKKYNKLYQELHNELSTKELQKFDKILDTLNNINNDELISIYKTATYDFLNLKNNQFIKNNNKKIVT